MSEGNFKSRQKCQKILAAPCKMERFQLINNLFSAKFCRTFEITSLVNGIIYLPSLKNQAEERND